MKVIRYIYDGMGLVSEWTGRAARWLVVIIIAITVYDVFMRYILNAPTNWSWCLSYMLGACFIAVGLAYTYYHQGNVRVDIIYSRFSPKGKLLVDIVFTLLFFFPLFFMLARLFIQDAWFAYSVGQFDGASIWYPLTWPFKSVVAVGFVFLCLQGTATFLKDVMALVKGGKEPW
ncbi:hypothetical protein ES703_89190 [subsurface metagenome]